MKKTIILASLLVAATASQAQEYGRVISSNPIIVQSSVTQQVCSGYTEQRVYDSNPQAGLLGAVIGGVIGNNLSSRHQGASTVAGAIAGAAIGSQMGGQYRSQPVRDCYSTYVPQNNVVGYDVWYEYRGGRYQTRTSYDPGRFIAINSAPNTSVYIVQEPVYINPPPFRRGPMNRHDRHERYDRRW